MISYWGDKIAYELVASDIIPSEDMALYAYGFFLLLSKALFLLVVSILGAVFGIFQESILFYLLFSILREYAGGIHAKTEGTCIFCTILMFLLSVSTIWALVHYQNTAVAFALLFFGFFTIILLSPLDTPEKPLSNLDRQHFQRVARGLATTYVILGIVAAIASSPLLYIVAVSEALAGLLLLGGKIDLQRRAYLLQQ